MERRAGIVGAALARGFVAGAMSSGCGGTTIGTSAAPDFVDAGPDDSTTDHSGSIDTGAGPEGGGGNRADGAATIADAACSPSDGPPDALAGEACACPAGPNVVEVEGDGPPTTLTHAARCSGADTPDRPSAQAQEVCGRVNLLSISACAGAGGGAPCFDTEDGSITYIDRSGHSWKVETFNFQLDEPAQLAFDQAPYCGPFGGTYSVDLEDGLGGMLTLSGRLDVCGTITLLAVPC